MGEGMTSTQFIVPPLKTKDDGSFERLAAMSFMGEGMTSTQIIMIPLSGKR